MKTSRSPLMLSAVTSFQLLLLFWLWTAETGSALRLQRNNQVNQETDDAHIETFEINLDLHPEDRWVHVATKYMHQSLEIIDFVLDSLPSDKRANIEAGFEVAAELWPHNEQIRQEMKGIAKVLGQSKGTVLLLNVFYEFTNACTSVVAQDSNGTMWHGRNLDYNIPHLAETAVHLHFIKNGEILYKSTTYALYIGIPTGMRPGAFSISQDQRYMGGSIWENVLEWILKGGQGYSFLIRDILETETLYEQAVRRLQTTPLISPAYFIVAGVHSGQGAVISRDRNSAADSWLLKDVNDWFLVQTNDDHWLPPQDDRRDATNQHLNLYNPSRMNADTMKKVMNMPPTLNDLTTYTSVMCAKKDYFESRKQNIPKDPSRLTERTSRVNRD